MSDFSRQAAAMDAVLAKQAGMAQLGRLFRRFAGGAAAVAGRAGRAPPPRAWRSLRIPRSTPRPATSPTWRQLGQVAGLQAGAGLTRATQQTGAGLSRLGRAVKSNPGRAALTVGVPATAIAAHIAARSESGQELFRQAPGAARDTVSRHVTDPIRANIAKRQEGWQARQPPAEGPIAAATPTTPSTAVSPGFMEQYGELLGGGAVGAAGIYALHKLLSARKARKAALRRGAFEGLPKAAMADPARFCDEFPKLASFLCYCHAQDLGEAQIVAGIEQISRTDHELDAEMEKLAVGGSTGVPGLSGPVRSTQQGGPWNFVKRQAGNVSRSLIGAGAVLTGGAGVLGAGAIAAPAAVWNQTAGRLGAPKLPAAELGGYVRDFGNLSAAGLKDIAGANVNAYSPAAGMNIRPGGRYSRNLRRLRDLGEHPSYYNDFMEDVRGRYGVDENTRQWSRGLQTGGEMAATAAPFAAGSGATLGRALVGTAPFVADMAVNEGPVTQAYAGAKKMLASRDITRLLPQVPAQLAELERVDPALHAQFAAEGLGATELHARFVEQIRNEIRADTTLGEGARQRELEVAPVYALAATQRFYESAGPVTTLPPSPPQEGQPSLEQPSPESTGPPAGQNVNIPAGADAAAAPAGQAPAMAPSDMPFGLAAEQFDQLPAEQQTALGQASAQVTATIGADPKAAEQALTELRTGGTDTPAGQTTLGKIHEQTNNAQTTMQLYGQMGAGSKMLLWGGLALGVVGLLSALLGDDEEGGGLLSWITALLGGGAAMGAAGYGGLLGQGVQGGIQSLFGKATGEAPSSLSPPSPPPSSPPSSPELPPAVMQSALQSIRDARADGLTAAESANLLQNPDTRAALAGSPPDVLQTVFHEGGQDPATAAILRQMATADRFGRGPADVLATPVGTDYLGMKQLPGQGYSRPEADTFVAAARQWAEANPAQP